jgi:transcriptional regulator with XRE-family HTH domain
MKYPDLRAVPDASNVETSPLGAARLGRRLTIEEAAARAGLDPEDIRCLEEGRIYRFPSVDDALAAALIYATALGISKREARRIAGLPAGRGRWSVRRWLGMLGFLAALAAFAWFAVVPELWDRPSNGSTAPRSSEKLPPPWEVRVDVYNGTEVPNAATRLANEIGGPLAYRLGTVENAERLDYTVTRVYYPPGSREIAERLAHDLGVGTAALPGGDDAKRLIVIVGLDLARRA